MPFVPTIRTTYDRHHHQPPIMLVTLRPVREWILVCFSPPIPRNLPRTFFSFSLSLFPSFLPSFFSLSPLSPRPATTTLFSPHGLYFFARDANDTGIYGDATIISHSERKKERKKDFLEGRKEREKKDFLPFLSLLGLLPFLVSTRGILLSQFYRLANDRHRERLRRR